MTRKHRALRIFMLLIVLSLVASACGKGGGGGQSKQITGVKGGTFKIAASGDVDYIDPGQIYYTFSYMLFRIMVRNLVTYPALPGEAGNRLVADIATNTGDVSADGLTYSFTIKDGIKYQKDTAAGRQVKSADIRYAIERGFYPSVANGYASLYFKGIFAGDEAFLTDPKPGVHITGIDVSNDKKIVFNLKKPTGDFLYRLALPLASPVPEEYATPYDKKAQSEYGPNLAATGPYKLERTNGKVTGYTAGKKIAMVRNENWLQSTDAIRKAFPNRFEVTEGFEDTAIATDKILAGEFDYNGDFTIPPEKIKTIVGNPVQKTKIFFNPTNCFRYVSLNTRIKPFNKKEVRQAVAYVLNKSAMRLTRGGKTIGDIATHVLIPGINGFNETGGRSYDPYPSKDFVGDVEKAKALMVKAGYPNGMYNGPAVLMVHGVPGVAPKTAEVVAASLAKIGIKVNRQGFKSNIMYTKYLSVPKQNVAVGPNPGWCWDYPDSFTVIGALFDGRLISATGNNNYAELKDDELNGLIDKAKAATGTRRATLWAEANKKVMELVPVVPWLWDSAPNLISSRVVGYQFTLASSSIDLAVASLKVGSI
jgi:peptide/nickel transport system substrate-binding protein